MTKALCIKSPEGSDGLDGYQKDDFYDIECVTVEGRVHYNIYGPDCRVDQIPPAVFRKFFSEVISPSSK